MQVVCEKGLGNNGMTLTSLKEEGFKAVFVGIGECHKHFRNYLCIYCGCTVQLCVDVF